MYTVYLVFHSIVVLTFVQNLIKSAMSCILKYTSSGFSLLCKYLTGTGEKKGLFCELEDVNLTLSALDPSIKVVNI